MLSLAPTSPVNFSIMDTVESMANILVFIDWEAPLGIGPAFFIQSYNVIISSDLEYYTYNIPYTSTSLNVTLNYNVKYAVSISSISCAGESEPLFGNFSFSEYIILK